VTAELYRQAREAMTEWFNGDDGAVDELPTAPPRHPYDPVAIGIYVLRMNGFLGTSVDRWGRVEISFFYRPDWRSGPDPVANWSVCPECDEVRTPAGHDPCIANLGGVAFACCGHGVGRDAYVATVNGRSFRGEDAIARWARWLRTPEGRFVSELNRHLAEQLWWVPAVSVGRYNGDGKELDFGVRFFRLMPRGRCASCQLPRAECTCTDARRRTRRDGMRGPRVRVFWG
jgi:hypothetical protein